MKAPSDESDGAVPATDTPSGVAPQGRQRAWLDQYSSYGAECQALFLRAALGKNAARVGWQIARLTIFGLSIRARAPAARARGWQW